MTTLLEETVDYYDKRCNMYGCLPCPKCGSSYRASYKTSKKAKEVGHPVIECDDCGYVSKAIYMEPHT